MRLGFLGGSFDPIHMGHVQAALIAAAEAKLDRVYLLPTGHNWQKAATVAPIGKRREWVERVAQSDPRLGLLDTDLRAGPIYAIDTIKLLEKKFKRSSFCSRVPAVKGGAGESSFEGGVGGRKQQFPRSELFWIIGGDQLANLPTWHKAPALAKALSFFVLMRENYPFTQPQLPGTNLVFAHRQVVLTSSTRLRKLIASHQDVSGLLPPSIADDVIAFYQAAETAKR